MKLKIIWIFLLANVTVSYAQDDALNKFVQDVYNTIVNNNYEAFKIYTVSKTDYPELNSKQIFKDETTRKNYLSNQEKVVSNHQTSMKFYFEKVQKNAKNAGIQWSDCKYTGYRVIKKTPIKSSHKYDIALQFVYKSVGNYEIHLNDCYQLKKGWVIWKLIGGPW